MTMNPEQAELVRQLRAAREGRYRQNKAGRYVIDGEARPDRRARERLIYTSRFLIWSHGRDGTVSLKLTSEGESGLRSWEASGDA